MSPFAALSELFDTLEAELERDPIGSRIGEAFSTGARAFADAVKEHLDSGAAPSAAAPVAAATAPPSASDPAAAVDTSATPPAPPGAETPAPSDDEDTGATLSADPTVHKCPECGAYYTGPAVCAEGHPNTPAATVELDEVPTPVAPEGNEAADAGDAANSAAAAAAASPDWPAGS